MAVSLADHFLAVSLVPSCHFSQRSTSSWTSTSQSWLLQKGSVWNGSKRLKLTIQWIDDAHSESNSYIITCKKQKAGSIQMRNYMSKSSSRSALDGANSQQFSCVSFLCVENLCLLSAQLLAIRLMLSLLLWEGKKDKLQENIDVSKDKTILQKNQYWKSWLEITLPV